MDQDKYSKVLSRLQAQCSRREYCTSDIRAKALKSMEGDAEAADSIVTSLKEDKFVDDLQVEVGTLRAGPWIWLR